MSTPSPLRGVAVGAGYFSRFQYESWNRMDGVAITALCNRSPDKASAMAADFNIPITYGIDRYEEMLDRERPDFVDIITPPDTHVDLVEKAARRGIAVICQKPLAPSWEESVAFRTLLQEHPVPFMVHENFRWQPWYRKIRQLLDEGAIGTVLQSHFRSRPGDGWGDDAYLARQPFFREYPRLYIYETGVHFLDTFRFLFGEVQSIYARTAQYNPVIKGEDAALLLCEHAEGAHSTLDANRFNETDTENPRYTFGTFRIDGSAGHLELDLNGHLTLKPLGRPTRPVDFTPSREGFSGDCVHAVQSHFVETLRGGGVFESHLDDYLESVLLVEAAYASAETGQPVDVATFRDTLASPE